MGGVGGITHHPGWWVVPHFDPWKPLTKLIGLVRVFTVPVLVGLLHAE